MEVTSKPKVIFVPGNGSGSVYRSNWYAWAASEIKSLGFPVALENFPDPVTALESSWIPFIRENLAGGSENIILIGHSSGAAASLRYLEKYKAVGCILVSAYWTDLGMESEAISNYFSRPWNFSAIGEHAKWILQFGSKDDPFIPIGEMRHVSEKLSESSSDFKYVEYDDKGHFMTDTFPELIQVFKKYGGK